MLIDIERARELGGLGRGDRPRLVDKLSAWSTPGADDDPAAATGLAFRGGRAAALDALAVIDPVAYARTRNHVAGAVTRLSPWIRHGVLGLAEVRDAALARVDRPANAEKLVSELAWRDYWRRVHGLLGAGIHDDLEGPALLRRQPAGDALPADVLAGRTGLACIDAFVARLHDTGWLHNHERMWLASWLVHVRGVRWQAGADWFLRHLLDGDPASNHLSWQWVAGTFSSKPYLFNRENLERYTDGAFCGPCPLLGHCDVEGSYEALTQRLFTGPPAAPVAAPQALRRRTGGAPAPTGPTPAQPLVWITLDAASATSPAVAAHPDAPRVFVLDPDWLAGERPSLKRLVFLFECLADLPGLLVIDGRPTEVLPAAAATLGCDGLALAQTPCERVRAALGALETTLPARVLPWPPFCDASRVDDLRRFSRYWQRIRNSALRPTDGTAGSNGDGRVRPPA